MARTFPKDIHGMVSWVPNTLNAKLPGAKPYMSHIDMGGGDHKSLAFHSVVASRMFRQAWEVVPT